MRDALVAAITLNIFNNHSDKVVMANVAQMVNNLHSLFLASGGKTSSYHVFDMYKDHQGGEAVRVLVDAGTVAYLTEQNEERQIDRISCSASIKDGKLTLTLVNCHWSEEAEVRLDFYGGSFKSLCTKETLNASDPHICNIFETPYNIEKISLSEVEPVITLPPASVVTITMEQLS